MDLQTARTVARRLHAGQLTRSGAPLIEHVERVARAVPKDARALAYLHDVLERSARGANVLRASGLTRPEYNVLNVLTRKPGETYVDYVDRIARARGAAGRLARMIKRADLNDHLSHRAAPDAPDYRWARRRIVESQNRRGEGQNRRGEGQRGRDLVTKRAA